MSEKEITLSEIMQTCAAAIEVCPDMDAAITRLAPNGNTIALGLIAFFFWTGENREQIIDRFRGSE
jgi:hypothetical protein